MNKEASSSKMNFGAWAAIGVGIGVAIGAGINNFGIGIAIGVPIAFLIAIITKRINTGRS